MQDFFEARGKTFLYLITPSKPAVYPGHRAGRLRVSGDGTQDRRDKLPVWDGILDRAGVHYADTARPRRPRARRLIRSACFRAAASTGTVWPAPSSAAQAVTEAVNRLHGSALLTPFTISWKRSFTPEQSDLDFGSTPLI